VVEALVNLRCARTALPEYWPLARTRARLRVAVIDQVRHGKGQIGVVGEQFLDDAGDATESA